MRDGKLCEDVGGNERPARSLDTLGLDGVPGLAEIEDAGGDAADAGVPVDRRRVEVGLHDGAALERCEHPVGLRRLRVTAS
jgi:hypothetical protein